MAGVEYHAIWDLLAERFDAHQGYNQRKDQPDCTHWCAGALALYVEINK